MNLLEKLVPKNIRDAQEERVKTTEQVVTASRKKRRKADTEVIKAYRGMGQRIRHHTWSE